MPRRFRPSPLRPLAALTAGLLCLAISEQEADAAVGYVRSTVAPPWGSTTNEQAMDLVFGVGGWDDLRYETVDPNVLLSPTYTFLYLEGSDNNALELQAFLMANQADLEAWVSAGGGLLLNAAPNEGGNQAWGFGGVVLNNGDFPVDPGTAVDPAHPIWNGPFLPTALMWTGGSYAHASVSGPGLVALAVDADGGNPNLAELPAFGAGRVIFGGVTTSNFWDPAPEALNLRANMIAYLQGTPPDSDCCTVSPTGTPGCTDEVCEAAVCLADAFCCNNDWDMLCTEGAAELCALCTVCGDNIVGVAEDCDDGAESATCDADCTAAMCGDGTINATAGETCDDGGRSPGCNADCTLTSCGDGVLNASAGEQCDDMGESGACDADCTFAMCGDGNMNAAAGEECDDGNTDDGDGCASDCTVESMGSTGGGDSDGGDGSTGGGDGSTGGGDGTAGPGPVTGGGTGGVDPTAGADGDGSATDGSLPGLTEGSAGDDDSGCGCSSTPRGGGMHWLLGLLGLAGLRRRRQPAA